MTYETFKTIVKISVVVSVFVIALCIHPEPIQEIRRKSKLRALKITTVGGKAYWQIQKRLPIINRWINAVDFMCLYYDPLRFDNPKAALEFIEAHYAREVERQNNKPSKKHRAHVYPLTYKEAVPGSYKNSKNTEV